MTIQYKNLTEEFNEFLSAPEVKPPSDISESILLRVHQELNPPQEKVFLKMLGIHAVVSVFSLSLCSQFGFQIFQIFDAMSTFMSVVGHTYCMVLCGALYIGLSALIFSFVMTPEEIKIIRQHKLLQLTLLSGLSLGFFLCTGAEVLLLPSVLWITGSLLGGIFSLELGWFLRSKIRQKLIFGL